MAVIDLKGKEAAWMQFFHMIQDECPHCVVEDLVVSQGAAVDYDIIRISEVPPREAIRTGSAGVEALNGDWEWLIRRCQRLRDGIIPEVHFRGGSPCALFRFKHGKRRAQAPQGGDRKEPEKLVPALV